MANSAIPERYVLPELPTIAGVEPTSNVLDVFRVAAAQSVSEAIGVEIEKVLPGIDISMSYLRGKNVAQVAKPGDGLAFRQETRRLPCRSGSFPPRRQA
jgi:hypothetical protein